MQRTFLIGLVPIMESDFALPSDAVYDKCKFKHDAYLPFQMFGLALFIVFYFLESGC